MLRLTLSFPLGVYHAQSAGSPSEPEWPPSPLRLIGALLAAAHGRRDGDPAQARRLIQLLCEQPAPVIVAPDSVPLGAPADGDVVVRLRGATRWVPRNYADARGVSPRNLGRGRAEAGKPGVAIGDRPVHVVWPDLDLDAADLRLLETLATDVTFVGTTRSPALIEVGADPVERSDAGRSWRPAPAAADGVDVRVPDDLTIADFDRREAARRGAGDRVRPTGLIPQLAIGQRVRYLPPGTEAAADAVDPHWWGELLVLAIDGAHSDLQPKAPATYLLARAIRAALLDTFAEAGAPGEAPPILTARGSDPHCAFVPLPHVWGDHADGRILGVAVVFPHERRVPDLAAQRARVLDGLAALLPRDGADGSRPAPAITLPGAGDVRLATPDAAGTRRVTLRPQTYRGPARRWVSVTPVVHSRWRKGGAAGLLRQVTADCVHVGLPEPVRVELLKGPGRRGGAARTLPVGRIPEKWRGPLQGPSDHLAITFAEPVVGPVLLGKARHFGLGLCVPSRHPEDETGGEA
jgi:CRISPR-associated protein Csb2